MLSFPSNPPAILKPIVGLLKTATDHEKLDPIVAYWCRLYAFQLGLQIDNKSKESLTFLTSVMSWLEEEKKLKAKEEAISNEIVAQAHLENHAMKLFKRADDVDFAGKADRNVAKLFFTSSQIFDALKVFGEVTDEVAQKTKYAKWRAAYITKCIKNGETPKPPPKNETEKLDGIQNYGPNQSDEGLFSTSSSNVAPYPTENFEGQPTIPYNDFFSKNNQNTKNDFSSLANQNLNPLPTDSKPNISQPLPSTDPSFSANVSALNGVSLSPHSLLQAQKYCKWAGSALQYEDVTTAVKNLEKALYLLKMGEEIK